MRHHSVTIVFSLLLLLPFAGYAGTASERLDKFFTNVQAMQADFHQTLLDDKGNTVKEASGTLVMDRPGKFRWDYRAPYQQLIVADGKKIWIYDGDLEQVTVKPMDATLGDTPALLLSGTEPLDKNFIVTDFGSSDGVDWVELVPKVQDSSFERVRLGFDQNNLRHMVLIDNFGQTTELDFTNLQDDISPDPKLFAFTPPPGVDVIGEE